MRLKVQIEWQGQPWGRRVQVQILSVVDGIFGLLLAIVYIVKIFLPDLEPETSFFTPRDRLNILLALVFLVAANLLQTIHAFRLCCVVSRTERDPPHCHRTAKTWFDFTEFSYMFAVVKCIATVGYILKVAPHVWVLVLTVITIPECVFKLYMLYVVYSFMEDLRRSLQYLPKFRFIPVGSISSEMHMQKMHEMNLQFNGDINANTQLIA